MSATLAEFIGTTILILLGNGVVANVVLRQSKGNNGGWMVVTAGWAFAVMIAVYFSNAFSGAHLNPAVSIGMAVIGKFEWALVPGYIAAQMAGAFLGAVLVWLAYLPHWQVTDDAAAKHSVFCTSPAIRHTLGNLISEIFGTAVLVLGVLAVLSPDNIKPDSGFQRSFSPVLVGLLVWSIGLSLGGPTGYAINPARDLGPRLAHCLLPIPGKSGPDWGYAWIPIVGPIIGGILGAFVYKAFWPVV